MIYLYAETRCRLREIAKKHGYDLFIDIVTADKKNKFDDEVSLTLYNSDHTMANKSMFSETFLELYPCNKEEALFTELGKMIQKMNSKRDGYNAGKCLVDEFVGCDKKLVLVYTHHKLDSMHFVAHRLRCHNIDYEANLEDSTIKAGRITLIFTSDLPYIMADGRYFDQIFVAETQHPKCIEQKRRPFPGMYLRALSTNIYDAICDYVENSNKTYFYYPARGNGKTLTAIKHLEECWENGITNYVVPPLNINKCSNCSYRNESRKALLNKFFGSKPETPKTPKIKNVIFNDPATIVFWEDGSKTVVKAEREAFDPEKGLAMAISKKALGNNREYYHTFLHWLKKHPVKNYLCMYCGTETTNPAWDHACDECSEDCNKKYNPVQLAYDILVKCRDHKVNFDIDDIIGYLGEALED